MTILYFVLLEYVNIIHPMKLVFLCRKNTNLVKCAHIDQYSSSWNNLIHSSHCNILCFRLFDMSVNIERFIDSVKEIITEKGLTVTAFANFLGIKQSCLSKWLNGENTPSLEYVILLADKTGFSVDYLFCIKDEAKFKPNGNRSCFAERLQTLLDDKAISKNKLAKECGVQSSTVSKWLLRGQLPKPETAIKLADFFDCSIDYLVGRE